MKEVADRLALGTAQLGMPYGIANRTGKPDLAAARSIVDTAWDAGIRYFDTAQAYGDSESVLGQALENRDAAIITKLPPKLENVSQHLRESLRRLGRATIWGVLLHREEHLEQWNGPVGQALASAKADGLVAHIGASVYSPEKALKALEMKSLDALQVPANIFDRRMSRAGVFRKAAERGVTIFVRSVYLQGLALLPAERVAKFGTAAVAAYEQFCKEHDLDRRRFALQYALGFAPDPVLVIGAETPEQVAANCAQATEAAESLRQEWDHRWPDDLEPLVNPSLWPS